MSINNEIDNLYLGQALLDAAMQAKAEYDQACAEARFHMENDECVHPPLTKKGKHDKRVFCNDCWKLYDEANHRAMILGSDWAGAFQLINRLAGDTQ